MSIKTRLTGISNPADLTLREVGKGAGKISLAILGLGFKAGLKVASITKTGATGAIKETWNKAKAASAEDATDAEFTVTDTDEENSAS